MKPAERANAIHVAMRGKKRSDMRDGYTLIIDELGLVRNKADEVAGVDAMVRLVDDEGREVKIDPHRVILNPPTQVVESREPRVLRADPEAAIWEVLWQSVLGVQGVRK